MSGFFIALLLFLAAWACAPANQPMAPDWAHWNRTQFPAKVSRIETPTGSTLEINQRLGYSNGWIIGFSNTDPVARYNCPADGPCRIAIDSFQCTHISHNPGKSSCKMILDPENIVCTIALLDMSESFSVECPSRISFDKKSDSPIETSTRRETPQDSSSISGLR